MAGAPVDTDAAAAEARYVLPRFIRSVSPGRQVRAAAGQPGAWLNYYPESIPAEQATTDRPVTVYLTRRNRKGTFCRFVLLVFDLDASRAGHAQVRVDAEALTRALAAHGIRCVPVVSGPSGGMHLWAACPEGLEPALVRRIAEAAERLYPTLDKIPLTNGTSGGVRPPGSLHRAGGYARLAEHTVEEAVAILRQGAGADSWNSFLSSLEAMTAYPALLSEARARATGPALTPVRHRGQLVPPSIAARGPVVRPVTTDDTGRIKLARPWQPLNAKALARLRRRPQDRSGAHSAAAHAPARTLALAGGSYQQLRELAADEELSPALEWLRTTSTPAGGRIPLTQVEADRRAERVWWLAVQDAARLPKRPTDDRDTTEADTPGARAGAELVARIEAADPERWNRPSGLSDRNLLYAVAYVMQFSGAAEVSADVRRMAVLMGRAKSTAALALHRVLADGWFTTTTEADQSTFTARRIQLADSHPCTDSPHHLCAVHQAPPAPQKTPGQPGSDGTPNTPPPATDRGIRLEDRIAFQQSGLWTAVGHTVGRTLEALENGTQPGQLGEVTRYRARTTLRHLNVLTTAGLLTWTTDDQGCPVAVRTAKTLYEAAADYGTATRPGERAMAGYVDRARWAWCLREAEYCRLTAEDKRRNGPRADARQLVLAGCDPHARAYPRTADGEFDHPTAWEIEALRTNALAIALAADALARAGKAFDPARLAPAQATEPTTDPYDDTRAGTAAA
ncbi:hypothetical protein ACFXKW_20785 [Streptomyces sp. NPDC059193]|uniref:hypothetical protein n=1 Tax=Streptomyces sp. NPDC059193 TaxID=3346763 RepID=UPI00367373BB